MIINLFLILTGFLGFITLFIILFGYKTNRIINIYITLIIFFSSFRLLLIGLNELVINSYLNYIIHHNNIIFIFLVPFFFLYFKNLITSQKNFVVKDLFHFILPTLFVLESRFSIIEFVFNSDRRYILLYIFILYIVVYDILIFFKLNKNIWHKKGSLEIVIKQNSLIKKWSIYLYTALNLILIRLIISLFLEKKLDDFISGQYAIWLTSIVWVVIFIKILSSPEILYGYSLLNKKSKENKNYITTKISHWKVISKAKITNVQDLQLNAIINQNIGKYIEEIENTSDNNYFRNSKFSLTDFALKLNIPKSHMTYLFKYHSKISFSDYKKIARIEDALHLIQADYLKTNTFDSLAKEVGFSSYNPFFTSFKDIVGKPPQEYCATLTGMI